MPTFMASVDDAQIEEIAKYYSQQRPALRTVPRQITILSAQP